MKTTSQKDDNKIRENETILMEKADAKMKKSKVKKVINHRIFMSIYSINIQNSGASNN